MGYKSVNFLGKDYEVSEAIVKYLDYSIIDEEYFLKLIKLATDNLKRDTNSAAGNWVNCADDDVKVYQNIMKETADYIVKELYKHNIYDVTATDILKDNTSINDVYKLAEKLMLKACDEGRKYVDAKNRGMAHAYHYAAQNITGTGFSILTNSLMALALHQVMEGSALLSQAKKADAEYQQAVQRIAKQTANEFDKMCNNIMLGEYYPGLASIFLQFHQDITKEFLVQMAAHDKFDFDSIQHYDMSRTNEMLKNIDAVPDKVDFLHKCFETCPFSEDLYITVFEQELLDADTFETAKYFKVSNEIIDRLESKLIDCTNEQCFSNYLAIYNKQFGYNNRESIKKLFGDRIAEIEKNIQYLVALPEDATNMKAWVAQNITNSIDELNSLEKQELINRINVSIDNILTANIYKQIEKTTPDIINVAAPYQNVGYETLKENLSTLIEDKIKNNLIVILAEQKKTRLLNLQEKESAIKEKKAIYAKTNEEFEAKISSLKNELDTLGFLALSKKINLKQEINTVEKERNNTTNTLSNEIKTLEEEYDNIKIDSIS